MNKIELENGVCDNCEPVGEFYLGMTCPKCLKPFRSVKHIDNSISLSWIEKDELAGIKLAEMRVNADKNSILYEVSSKILRQLIIEGIDIGLNYHK